MIEFGVIGLGRMGGNLALQALKKGMRIVGYDLGTVNKNLTIAGLQITKSLEELKRGLKCSRVIFIYVPAGSVVDEIIAQLSGILEEGDIIVDGGNSYWGDSIRRSEKLKEKGIFFVDLGTSGGVDGAFNGACFMAGGEKKAISHVEPILVKLAVKGGYVHAGSSGAGHFIKLVHNGIEFGMLQAIGEGIDLLGHYKDELNISDILKCWRNGSVIRSWLVDLMYEQYVKQKGGKDVPAFIEDTGEVNWLLNDAIKMEVAIPVIAQSVMQLFISRDQNKNWAKSIAMMRHGFGGHPFGQDENIALERRNGRVGGFYEKKSI